MTYKSINAQDKFWIIPSDIIWDGTGYPPTNDVRCCFIENVDELASFRTKLAELNTEVSEDGL